MTAKLDERFNQTSEALNQYKVDLRKSIGNIMSPLLWLPLKNSLDMITGTGSVTFSRASTATYIDRYGVLKYASINEPRFEKEGLLVEGPSTNLLLYSEDFSNSVWHKANGLTVTSNTTEVTAPDGSNNADIIEDTDNTQGQWTEQVVSIPDDGSIYTFSVFVKKKTSNICVIQINLDGGASKYSSILVNLDNGDTTLRTNLSAPNDPYDYRVKYIRDGWYRVSVSVQNNSTGNTTLKTVIHPAVSDMSGDYDVEATGSIYVWGAQLEKLPFASSYIPTTDSAVTRAYDTLVISPDNNVPSFAGDATVVLDLVSIGFISGREILSFTDTAGYHVGYWEQYASNELFWWNDSNDNSHAATYMYLPDSVEGKIARIGVQIENGLPRAFMNGVYGSERSNRPVCGEKPEIIRIGRGCNNFYAYVSNLRIYDKALTDEEVALL